MALASGDIQVPDLAADCAHAQVMTMTSNPHSKQQYQVQFPTLALNRKISLWLVEVRFERRINSLPAYLENTRIVLSQLYEVQRGAYSRANAFNCDPFV